LKALRNLPKLKFASCSNFGEIMQVSLKHPLRQAARHLTFGSALALPCLIALAPLAPSAFAQAPAAATRFVGTVTATASGSLKVKTDAGVEHTVTVPDGIKIQRVAPGAKDLSSAAEIKLSDIAVGDRVLVRLGADAASNPATAVSIVAIPRADVAQKQQQDRDAWQRNGVGGLVKSVEPGTGVIVITSGAGPTQKTITIHTTPATQLRRYAPDSVDFDKSKPAPLETIQPGDQLRARGQKTPDGNEIAADAVVSGSFRNISGTISAIDRQSNTLTLKDLVTKQTVTVHIGPDAQMRKLPEETAKMLASMTKSENQPSSGPARAQGGSVSNGPETASGAPPTPPAGATPSPGSTAPQSRPRGNGNGGQPGSDNGPGTRRGGDLQQVIARAPQIHLTDLQKGEAVMLVSTEGTSEVTAITLLAGVEPLLQAPASTQSMLLSNWNMSSGGADAAAQ
jgi:hypothetical protein